MWSELAVVEASCLGLFSRALVPGEVTDDGHEFFEIVVACAGADSTALY